MRRLVPVILAAVLLPYVSFAADAPQASGTFKGSHISFQATGAYAFWSRSADEGPLVVVAVSNDAFRTEAFDAFYDPEAVINTVWVDDQTAAVYFQFEPNGKFHGVSYYLGSGDGCGFCSDSEAKSTVRIAGNRAKGGLSYKGDRRTYDVQFDVPIAPQVWGKDLPKDGGEPGAAYRAYNEAMDKGNRKAIFDLLDADGRTRWSDREKKGKLDDYLDYRMEKVHWRINDVRIVTGFVRENQAVLLIRGSSKLLDHIHGQVSLTREGGKWKISDEIYQVGE